jgi:putative hydrolase of the HAD superfamily
MVPVKAVLFDYGMVLSAPPDPAAWARLRTLTNLTEEVLNREYWVHRHAYDRGDLTAEAYWHKTAAEAGIVLTPTQLTAVLAVDVDLWSQINAPMLEWAQRLQRAGIATGILSNIGDAMAAGILAKFDWLNAFNHRTWSYTLNLAKPEPAIYLHAIEGLQTPPENILFIDDKPENIAMALTVGMQAIQYATHNAFVHEMHARNLGSLLQLESPVSQIGEL